MSTHAIPPANGDVPDQIRWTRLSAIRDLCRAYLREPEDVTDDGTTLTLVFTPDLTGPQTQALNRIIRISGAMHITPTEWAAIEPDLSGLQTYLGIATPTSAQHKLAIDAMIHVVKVMLRD